MYSHFADILNQAFDDDMGFKLAFYGGDYEAMDDHYITCAVHTAAGATRVALIDDDYDWICKFDYDTDALGAVCAREYERYQAAKKFGIEDMFAEVVYLGTFARKYTCADVSYYDYEENEEYDMIDREVELELYAYKKASFNLSIFGAYARLSDEDKDHTDRRNSPLCGRNIDVGAAFLTKYGYSRYIKLDRFCRDFHINDLHGGNIGLIGDNIVIIDYAGYYDEEYSEDSNYDEDECTSRYYS